MFLKRLHFLRCRSSQREPVPAFMLLAQKDVAIFEFVQTVGGSVVDHCVQVGLDHTVEALGQHFSCRFAILGNAISIAICLVVKNHSFGPVLEYVFCGHPKHLSGSFYFCLHLIPAR